MHAMTKRCLMLETRFQTEPAAWLDRLLPALQPLAEVVKPTSVCACTPGGRVTRDRTFRWSTVEELAAQAATGTLTMNVYEGASPVVISLYLRHNPAIELHYQPPAAVWVAVEHVAGGSAWTDVLDAMEDFLKVAASLPGILHGGISTLDNLVQARSEITGTGTDVDRQPSGFRTRSDHDWRFPVDAWRMLRRLYWTTLLGPTLAAAAGGAAAARAAGAVEVQEVGGAIIVRAMAGPPRDSLDPEFLAATLRLRRWLWPHTFKNPLDAAGFEAEVGLPVAGAGA